MSFFSSGMSEDAKGRITEAVEKVKAAVAADSLSDMKESSEALQKIWHDEAGKMYAEQQQAQGADAAGAPGADGGPAGDGESAGGDDAVDAEYEVVDDEKK